MLHFGEIEIWAKSSFDKFTSVMEEVEGKIEDRTGNGCIVNGHPRLVEMPSSRTEKKSSEYALRVQMVKLVHTGQSRRRAFERACTACRRSQNQSGDEQHRTS